MTYKYAPKILQGSWFHLVLTEFMKNAVIQIGACGTKSTFLFFFYITTEAQGFLLYVAFNLNERLSKICSGYVLILKELQYTTLQ